MGFSQNRETFGSATSSPIKLCIGRKQTTNQPTLPCKIDCHYFNHRLKKEHTQTAANQTNTSNTSLVVSLPKRKTHTRKEKRKNMGNDLAGSLNLLPLTFRTAADTFRNPPGRQGSVVTILRHVPKRGARCPGGRHGDVRHGDVRRTQCVARLFSRSWRRYNNCDGHNWYVGNHSPVVTKVDLR